jgi:hypothetical protein
MVSISSPHLEFWENQKEKAILA